jgi:hypothetical protein
VLSIENLQGKLTDEQLEKIVKESLKDFSAIKRVLKKFEVSWVFLLRLILIIITIMNITTPNN